MAYRIEGLPAERFAHLRGLGEAALAQQRAVRLTATAEGGFPCRVSLDFAAPGESVLLLNHVSHDAPTPYRTAYAIYVRERARAAPVWEDALPPVLEGRMLSLRAFDEAGMLRDAVLARPGEAEERIGALFADGGVASIHAHSPAHGCFLARIGRS